MRLGVSSFEHMRGDSHVTPFIWMGLFLIEGVVVVWPGRGVRLGTSGRGS